MNLGQYVGSRILWRGREARVVRFTDSRDEMYFTCRYTDDNEIFYLNAAEKDTMQAIRGEPVTEGPGEPAPRKEPADSLVSLSLRRAGAGDLIFSLDGEEYLVTFSEDGSVFLKPRDRASQILLRGALGSADPVKRLEEGKTLSTVTGRRYGAASFCALLAAAAQGGKAEYGILELENESLPALDLEDKPENKEGPTLTL